MLLLLCTSCLKKEENTLNEEINEKEDQQMDIVDTYLDDNETILGLYLYTNSYTPRKLITTYETEYVLYQDIVSLEVFATNEEEISGNNFQTVFKNYFDEEENKHKIGFEISFETEDNKYRKTILNPSDVVDIFDYVQIYLYDDVHKEIGAWYSHVTEEEYNEDTLLTSIKLTASTNIDKIISNITVIAFSYDEDDFDEEGFYRGKSKWEVKIVDKS